MICDNLGINEKGHLTFAGRDTVELAEKYGTPAYIMDEEKSGRSAEFTKRPWPNISAANPSLFLPANHYVLSRYTG